jgi:hypothetical protein
MTPSNPDLPAVVDELANALQSAVVLAAKLATSLRADAHEADVLYQAVGRAVSALQRLRPDGDRS